MYIIVGNLEMDINCSIEIIVVPGYNSL